MYEFLPTVHVLVMNNLTLLDVCAFLLQDITNLAPRKPDWDLKRDVAKKLERLERRTQKAIAELIRERLKKGQEDLVTSVNIGANASQNLDVDED